MPHNPEIPATYSENDRVKRAMDRLASAWQGRAVSDIVDGQGNQYVDFVLEGGGILGIALVGYTYALEQVGIRFLRIGGTSAGAINALLLAAAAEPQHTKTPFLLEELSQLPMDSFMDGSRRSRRFLNGLLNHAGLLTVLWRGLFVCRPFWRTLGFNPGDAFLEWLERILTKLGIETTADLYQRMGALPDDLSYRDGNRLPDEERLPELALVTADVTTETKVVFPKMASMYFAEPDRVSPAQFVRASMSIPYFFRPYRVGGLPDGDDARAAWNAVGYGGEIPSEVLFMDGGIVSNFPIAVFHSQDVPTAPTLGVKLGADRGAARSTNTPTELGLAIFDAARHAADFEFLYNNPDYRHLVGYIDTGDHHWLNFSISPEDQADLFARGIEAAAGFLKEFDWEEYKQIRRELQGVRATGGQRPGGA